jgi:predicted nucleic acid-binding Zn ribbon protein
MKSPGSRCPECGTPIPDEQLTRSAVPTSQVGDVISSSTRRR